MGRVRKNRLRFRIIHLLPPVLGAFAGYLLPEGFMREVNAALVGTFFGLIASSILPTIGLLISSLESGDRSVSAVEKLTLEIKRLIKNLLYIFLNVICTIIILIIINIKTPEFLIYGILDQSFYIILGQVFFMAILAHTINRTFYIPHSIFKCIDYRASFATVKSKERLRKRIPKADEIKAMFPTKENFGKENKLY